MSVYVDKAQHPYGRMIMCHMLADTPEELFAMSDALLLRRQWFQHTGTPHFDIGKGKRAKAIELGAVEVDNKGLVEVIKSLRLTNAFNGVEKRFRL